MNQAAFWIAVCICLMAPGAAADDADEAETVPTYLTVREGDLEATPLPRATRRGGMALMQALAVRESNRSFAPTRLGRQALGDMLWAAWGVNRVSLGKRTAPSAMNWQDLEVWVVTEEAAFVYDAKAHALIPKKVGDLRAVTGKQDFVAAAPINLVYVSDTTKMTKAAADRRQIYAAIHSGLVSQNVSLYCAARGFANVMRASFDEDALRAALGLSDQYRIVLTQTVGYKSD